MINRILLMDSFRTFKRVFVSLLRDPAVRPTHLLSLALLHIRLRGDLWRFRMLITHNLSRATWRDPWAKSESMIFKISTLGLSWANNIAVLPSILPAKNESRPRQPIMTLRCRNAQISKSIRLPRPKRFSLITTRKLRVSKSHHSVSSHTQSMPAKKSSCPPAPFKALNSSCSQESAPKTP